MNDYDFYYHSKSDSEENSTDPLLSNKKFLITAPGIQSHFQSMDTIQEQKPSTLVRAANAVKIISTVIIGLLIFIAVFALATNGNALFFDRVEGEVTDRVTISNAYSRSYTVRYAVTITYTYKCKEYKLGGGSINPLPVGQKVYVHIKQIRSVENILLYKLIRCYAIFPADSRNILIDQAVCL